VSPGGNGVGMDTTDTMNRMILSFVLGRRMVPNDNTLDRCFYLQLLKAPWIRSEGWILKDGVIAKIKHMGNLLISLVK
jgi:hypothetical protein